MFINHLTSFGAKNFKSFDTNSDNAVPIKRVNIFLGRNSSGKSSLLRILPLLRQSIETQTSKSPILWLGKLVDFDSYNNVKNKNTRHENEELNAVSFSFNFDYQPSEYIEKMILMNKFPSQIYDGKNLFLKSFGKDKLKFQADLALYENHTKLVITINDNKNLRIEVDYFESSINSYTIYYKDKNFEFKIEDNAIVVADDKIHLFPIMDFFGSINNNRAENDLILKNLFEKISYSPFDAFCDRQLLQILVQQNCFESVKKFQKALTKLDATIAFNAIQSIAFHFDTNISAQNMSLFNSEIMRKHINENSLTTEIIDYIQMNRLMKLSHSLIEILDLDLITYLSGIRYIAPIRATNPRFVSSQNLQIKEMDVTGSNLPMILQSLNKNNISELSNWLKENFRFELQVETSTSNHISIMIKPEGESYYYNLADVGFGYSQLLPLVSSIWFELNYLKKQNTQIVTFIIEQPELHLHPEYQYRLAYALGSLVSNNPNINLILETHSKPILDAFSQAIREKKLSNTDISMSLFAKNHDGNSSIRNIQFDESGVVQNWPAGFLSSGAI